jgi:hypothetical protein
VCFGIRIQMGLWVRVRVRIKNPGFRSRKAKIAWKKREGKKKRKKKKKREKTSCFEVLDVVFGGCYNSLEVLRRGLS